MRKLSDTITRLTALRARMVDATQSGGEDHLVDLGNFGSNPGALRARCFVPGSLPRNASLVVVLHGCTQTAAGYDLGSGWSEVAAEHGFALLYPEQQRANNPNLCFNWFNPEDARRDSGEALSIRQMVQAMVDTYGLDPSRVYVTGLSAGGAMASVMMATYPDVFAGGAIIAGLPFGTAASIPEAFDRMRGSGGPQGAALGALVRAASDHQGPWPIVSVWHGDRDMTVAHSNAAKIVEQWRDLHGAAAASSVTEDVAGYPRRVWRDSIGRDVIEEYQITGLGHGTPLRTSGEGSCGAVAPYMLEAGISSTRRIANFWGLMAAHANIEQGNDRGAAILAPDVVHQAPARAAGVGTSSESVVAPGSIKAVIEDALRAAGLMG